MNISIQRSAQASAGIIIALLTFSPLSAEEAYTGLTDIPELNEYCLDAQRVVVRTNVEMDLVVHSDFDSFVKSKAIIEGPNERPQIQQYNWFNEAGEILGISCKLKNTDHLNMTFGPGSAGPDQPCQEMNRQVHGLLSIELGQEAFANYKAVIFDPNESPGDPENPGMTGPAWLKPYVMAYGSSKNGAQELHIATKGFIVEFSDPRFAKAPERFRGVHYCHFVAPEQFKRLMTGSSQPPIEVGKDPLAKDIADNTGPGQQ